MIRDTDKNYSAVMLSLAAKAALKAGMRRQEATLAFMAAFDAERERPRAIPGAVVMPAIGSEESANEVVAVTATGHTVSTPKRISSMRPPPEEPFK